MPLDYEVSNQDEFVEEWPDIASSDKTTVSIEKPLTKTKKSTSVATHYQSKQAKPNSSKTKAAVSSKLSNKLLNSDISSTVIIKPTSIEGKDAPNGEVLERVFMDSLIKHTVIALMIIVPLAAFSAYASPAPQAISVTTNDTNSAKTVDKTSSNKRAATSASLMTEPTSIIYKAASEPTAVDNVDLKKYAGTWYEIGRLPMYFQRDCASDVTATYTPKPDGSGIAVLNKCVESDGTTIAAEGLAKPVDDTGSKLKVTFLPSWIRWLPVGRADYWVLARDPDYQTALVGTPDREYLWLLARSPNITQETYAKYRQIAQEQGYHLKEFKLTSQTNQTVRLVP